jgi:hypothetical protein
MLRLSGTTSFALVFALALCANPLFAQGQGVLQPDVDLIANSGPFEFDGLDPGMDLGRSSVLDVSGGDFTIHAWVRFASLINGGPCYGPQCDMAIAEKINGEYNSSGWRLLKWSDGHFYFCLGGGSVKYNYSPLRSVRRMFGQRLSGRRRDTESDGARSIEAVPL